MTIAPTPTTAFGTAMQTIARRHLLLQYRLHLLAGTAWGLLAKAGEACQERGISGLDRTCQELQALEQDLAWTGMEPAALPSSRPDALPESTR